MTRGRKRTLLGVLGWVLAGVLLVAVAFLQSRVVRAEGLLAELTGEIMEDIATDQKAVQERIAGLDGRAVEPAELELVAVHLSKVEGDLFRLKEQGRDQDGDREAERKRDVVMAMYHDLSRFFAYTLPWRQEESGGPLELETGDRVKLRFISGLIGAMHDAYEEYAGGQEARVTAVGYFEALYAGAEGYLVQEYNFTLRPTHDGSILEMIFE